MDPTPQRPSKARRREFVVGDANNDGRASSTSVDDHDAAGGVSPSVSKAPARRRLHGGDATAATRIATLLAPLSVPYTRRAGAKRDEVAGLNARRADPDEEVMTCTVAGIAAIDDKGRVRLRSFVNVIPQGLSMLVADDMIRIQIDGAGAASLDERGRLSLPQSMIDAAGLRIGGRVAILEVDELTLGLASVERLGLRRRAAVA